MDLALGRPQHHGSTPKGTPLNFSSNRSGVREKWHAGDKSGNISETRKNRGKVTMDGL